MAYIYLIIAFCLNASANIILKIDAGRVHETRFLPEEFSLRGILNFLLDKGLFLLGIFLFALNLCFYYVSLRSMPLSLAYPIMVAMSVLIINSYANFFLGESISFVQVIGYCAIIAGVTAVFLGYRP